jgi:hypothetical protein
MRRARIGVAAASLALAGCGAGAAQPPAKGKRLHGATETGMRLEVDPFVSPRADARLARLDAYRAAAHYPPVDYHRVVADNTRGARPDSGRLVTFAPSATAIASGQGLPARFSCDVLRYEWVPPDGASAATRRAYAGLRDGLCADGPPKPDGIAPGARKVYYLITDRGFDERGLRRMRVFGPESAELR